MRAIVLSICAILSISTVFGEGFDEQKKQNYLLHGSSLFRQAKNAYQKEDLKKTVSATQEFILLYPDHPEKMEALKLLSMSYKKAGLYEKSIAVDTEIYLENPATEEGIKAYLDAARGYFKIGEMAKAKYILEKIREQDYFSSLSEDAGLELKIIQILDKQE